MKNQAFAGACIDQKSCQPEARSQGQPTALFSQRAKGNRSYRQLDLPDSTCFDHFRLVFEYKIGCWNAGRRVAKRTGLGNARYQVNMVHESLS